MTNCRNCGCVLQATDTFCPACGQDAAAQAAPAAPAAIAASAPVVPPSQPVVPPGVVATSGKATASLICGIFFFLCPVPIAAIILGHLALSDIKRSGGRLAGQGRAVVGLVLGYFGIAIVPILIIAAIAIPNLLRARMAANEASAVGSIRTLNVAEVSYATSFPNLGFTCDFGKLSAEGPNSKPLIDPILASGVRSGYRFELTGCVTSAEADPETAAEQTDAPFGVAENAVLFYQITATPVKPGNTGQRTFCSDQSGVIRFVLNGSPADCIASGDPLQ